MHLATRKFKIFLQKVYLHNSYRGQTRLSDKKTTLESLALKTCSTKREICNDFHTLFNKILD